MKQTSKRSGDNFYPINLTVVLGKHSLELEVPAGVWNPTPHGIHLGKGIAGLDVSGMRGLELGTGCGLHAIVLARQGAACLTLTEIKDTILENARHNLAKHEISIPVKYIVSDWTRVKGTFDALVTNPPFARSGKRYRRYYIDTLILDAHKLVRPGGWLIFVQSSMADIPRSIRLREENGMTVEIVGETGGPFRDYDFEDPTFLNEIANVPGSYTLLEGVYHERLIVFKATLPCPPPSTEKKSQRISSP